MYGGGSVDGNNDGVRGGGVDSGKQCGKRANSVLGLFSNSYSKLNAISVGVSGLFSCFISHCLLTTYSINYCPKKRVNDFGLKRLFLLQSQDLRVGQVKEPCIGLTQENSVQNCLYYILIPNDLCELFIAYPK